MNRTWGGFQSFSHICIPILTYSQNRWHLRLFPGIWKRYKNNLKTTPYATIMSTNTSLSAIFNRTWLLIYLEVYLYSQHLFTWTPFIWTLVIIKILFGVSKVFSEFPLYINAIKISKVQRFRKNKDLLHNLIKEIPQNDSNKLELWKLQFL